MSRLVWKTTSGTASREPRDRLGRSWLGARGVSGALVSSVRVRRLAVALVLVLLVLAMTGQAVAARVLRVRDEGHLAFVSSSGSQLIDEGSVTGTVPGSVRVHFSYNGNPDVTAQFTIRSRYGSITGHAQGRLSNPTSAKPSFRGSLVITGGSGRYARAAGSGELFGVFYRRSYGLTVQAIVTVRY